MKKTLLGCAVALLAGGLAQAGPLTNGTFETGTFGGWTTSGNTLVQGAFPTATGPLTGSFQAWMSTDDAGQLLGTDPAGLEAFLGIAPGTLAIMALGGNTPDRGSAILQSFDATAGDVLGFDFNFITADTFPDFAFYVIIDPVNSITATVLWRTSDPLNVIGVPYSESGTNHINQNLLLTGTYKIGFGIINVNDDSTDSILLVDNVTQATSGVPEPSTWAFMLSGFAVMAGIGLRKRGLLGNRALGLAGMLVFSSLAAMAQPLIISEFRFRGPSGANDEFVEIYNTSASPHTVSGAGTGYALVAGDGVTRFVIPNGTIIPGNGHYLGANSVAYSLGLHAIADISWTTDIPDNSGVALFNNSTTLDLAHRLDAAGFTSAPALYREGVGRVALTPFSTEYAIYRDQLPTGFPKDTDDNVADFLYGDTNGTLNGGLQRLGAPGPENLNSPIQRNSTIPCVLLEPTVGASSAPNRVVDPTSIPAQNSTFGQISYRRACINNTGQNITRLRFRVISMNTFPSPAGTLDGRLLTSVDVPGVVTTTHGVVTVRGTTLEQPPSEPNGAGFNATVSAPINVCQFIPAGGTIYVQWLLGVQQQGREKFIVNVEALTGSGGCQ